MNALTTIMCILSKQILVQSEGVMILYRPKDITYDCVNSHLLRFDLSYGMGLSDTLTIIFRTLNEINYECSIEFVTEPNTVMIVVIKYPNWISTNCEYNRNAFTLVHKKVCYPLCEMIDFHSLLTFNIILRSVEQIHLRFSSNSTINNNINANLYQVTATTARKTQGRCNKRNETACVVRSQTYCFTNGVACDGIKNCGVEDWYDEKKSDCGLEYGRLNKMAVVAVAAAFCLAVLAGGHWILKCLPPVATSFFIFHSNEDNRLYIQPVYKPNREESAGQARAASNTALSGSSSESDNLNRLPAEVMVLGDFRHSEESAEREKSHTRRTTTMRDVAARLQEKFRSVTGRTSSHRSGLDA